MAAVDKYDIEARYVPSLVSSVPFVLLGYYYLSGIDSAFWNSVIGIAIGSLGFTTAIFLVMVNFSRGVGKYIEERMFKQGISFPTTTFLLDGDTNLSIDRKKKIIRKINKHLTIDLRHSTADNELNRKKIHEAIGQIRRLFYKKNEMLLQRNIQFGFAKNLLGGSVIAVVVSTVALLISILSATATATLIAAILILIYVLIALVSVPLIKFTARHYAECLFDEFIAL